MSKELFAGWDGAITNNRKLIEKAGFGICVYCREKLLPYQVVYGGDDTGMCSECMTDCILPGDMGANEVTIELYRKKRFGE